jgi:hypothetical protein
VKVPVPVLAWIGVVAGADCHHADAQPESEAQLIGYAYFTDVVPDDTQIGTVRFILRGTGDISDDCPDANLRQWVAEYDGQLEVARDGAFDAHLVPIAPPVATPSGCPVTRVVVERVQTIMVDARLPGYHLEGFGWLDFQTLTSTDNDRLQRGSFDTLHATMQFKTVSPRTPR